MQDIALEQAFAAAGMKASDPFAAPAQEPTPAPAPAAPAAAEPPVAEPTPAPVAATPEPTPTPAPAEPTPAPTEPTPTPAPVVEFNWSELGVKDAQELKSRLAELEEKANKDPFASPYVKALNEAAAKGIPVEVFNAVYSVDPKNLTPAQAISLKYQWEAGLSKEEADTLVQNKYRLGEEYDETDPDVKRSRIELKVDAAMATTFIESHRAKELTSPVEQQVQQNLSTWQPVIGPLVQTYGSFKMPEGIADYAVSPDTLKAATELMNSVISSPGFSADPSADRAQVEMIARNYITATEHPKIVEHIKQQYEAKMATALREMELKHIQDKSNPRPAGGTPAPNAPLNKDEKLKGIVQGIYGEGGMQRPGRG